MADSMVLSAACAFDVPTLTRLFNEGFAGYSVPMHLSEEAFCDHVAFHDIDLTLSRVVADERPAAFSLVGRRGQTGWIGGMGTVLSHRRRGLGERALVDAIDAAAACGCVEIRLEVLVDNEPAIRLYSKLGFQIVRELAVWSCPPVVRETPSGAECVDIGLPWEWIAAHRGSTEPWQRADETLAAFKRRGVELRGLAHERGGDTVAAAIIRETAEAVDVVQISAVDEHEAASILLAAAGSGRTLRLANVSLDDPASLAMEGLGAERLATQYEMTLTSPWPPWS